MFKSDTFEEVIKVFKVNDYEIDGVDLVFDGLCEKDGEVFLYGYADSEEQSYLDYLLNKGWFEINQTEETKTPA